MRGDALASGQKAATFATATGKKGEPIELKNVAAPETEEELRSLVDNSALFAKTKPAFYYQGEPLGDMVLVKRIKQESHWEGIILPESALGKSDRGIVTGVGQGLTDIHTGKRTPLSVQIGDIVLFDKFASVGQEISLLDESGEESEQLILREHDLLLKLKKVATS